MHIWFSPPTNDLLQDAQTLGKSQFNNRSTSFSKRFLQTRMHRKDLDLHKKWAALRSYLKDSIGKRPGNVEEILYLVGMQELGKGPNVFSKEEKQDLIHIGTCKVLSLSHHYRLEGMDKEGWPHWTLKEPVPKMDTIAQETYLKLHIIEYFESELGLIL